MPWRGNLVEFFLIHHRVLRVTGRRMRYKVACSLTLLNTSLPVFFRARRFAEIGNLRF